MQEELEWLSPSKPEAILLRCAKEYVENYIRPFPNKQIDSVSIDIKQWLLTYLQKELDCIATNLGSDYTEPIRRVIEYVKEVF